MFAPSVIEPAAAAQASGGNFNTGSVGWGTYDAMLRATEAALGTGPFLLGERFTMADVILGGTLRYMLMFNMVEPRPVFADYVKRLDGRPACQRSVERNAAVSAERGLQR